MHMLNHRDADAHQSVDIVEYNAGVVNDFDDSSPGCKCTLPGVAAGATSNYTCECVFVN